MTKSYEELASDPSQYDNGDIIWTNEGEGEHYTRRLIKQAITPYLENRAGHHALDIGCGQGWLCKELSAYGARVLGIEPSFKNYRAAQKRFPNLHFENQSLEKFESNERFDLITATMVFEHIRDLDGSLRKIVSLMTSNGQLIILDGDFVRYTTPRFNYDLDVQKLNENEAATRTDYGDRMGIVYDIFRTSERFLKSAKDAGLRIMHHQEVCVPQWFVNEAPQYAVFLDRPIFQLYAFEKL